MSFDSIATSERNEFIYALATLETNGHLFPQPRQLIGNYMKI